MRISRSEPMPDRLVGDLVFWHRCDDLIVDEQAIYVEGLVACRVRRLELDCLATFGIGNAGDERCLEQLRLAPELFHDHSSRLEGLGILAPQIRSQKMIGNSPNSRNPAIVSTVCSYCGSSRVVSELVT